MSATRTMLAPGCTWNMSKEMKREVPLRFKIAATELAKQFHRVVCEHWAMTLIESDAVLQVSVFRDKDTLNPTYYNITYRNGEMYRTDPNRRGYSWPVFVDRGTTISPEPSREKAFRRPSHKTAEVFEDTFTDTFHSLCVQRAEINEQLRKVELKFLKAPSVEHVAAMSKMRNELTDLESQIVIQGIIEGGLK